MVVAVASIALLGLLNPASTKQMVLEPDAGGGVQESLSEGALQEAEGQKIAPADAANEALIDGEQSGSVLLDQPLAPRETLPVWFFGAIALTCAAGCFVLWRWLNRAGSPTSLNRKPVPVMSKHQTVHRSRRSPKARLLSPRKKRRKNAPVASLARTSANAQLVVARSAISQPVAIEPGVTQQLVKKTAAEKIAKANQTDPVITIVPPEENHPLDWGEASLADAMDLRKQQPLSSIL